MKRRRANRKTPEGLAYALVKETDSMKGKSGTLVIRSIGPGYDMGIGPNEVWMGRWSIVRGTGDYSGLTGGGRWVGVGSHVDESVTTRFAGFVTP